MLLPSLTTYGSVQSAGGGTFQEKVGGVAFMVINTLALNTSYGQTRNHTVVTSVFKSVHMP